MTTRRVLIGIAGLAGSGKSTVAEFLRTEHDFAVVSLADPIKRIAKDLFAFSDMQLWGPSSARNDVDPRYGVSPRHVLQQLGTEFGRAIWPAVWTTRALKDAASMPRVVIPDVRFADEADAIRAAGGVVWRVLRGEGLAGHEATHASECGDFAADMTIDNRHATLDQLRGMVAVAVEEMCADE